MYLRETRQPNRRRRRLEIGADDYLCKPFSMRELLARVKVLFRRAALEAAPKEAPLRVGDLELDLQHAM